MEEHISVSVFCTTYNQEKYIREALDGFINQKTKFSFEVLIHDDASTDGTADIIREYEKKYPNIIKPIYQQENQYSKGVSIALTYLYPRAKGKYIAFCEGDDYWINPFKLQRQFDYMEQHPECSLVSHEAKRITKEGKIIAVERQVNLLERNLDMKTVLANMGYIATASMFYRKEYYANNLDFLKTIKSFDYVLKIILLAQGTAYIINEEMSVYRVASHNSWTQRIAHNKKLYIEHIKQSIKILEKIDSYLDKRCTDIIATEILKRQFNLHLLQENYSIIKKAPYKTLYKNLPLKQRIAINFPFLLKVKQKMKRTNK